MTKTRTMILVRSAMLSGVAGILMTSAPLQAQTHPKPQMSQQMCGELPSGARLVEDGGPTQVRTPQYQEVGRPGYSATNPVATCGTGISRQNLKCVDAYNNNAQLTGDKCAGNPRFDYEMSSGSQVQSSTWNDSDPSVTYWVDKMVQLPDRCPDSTKYAWVTTPPSTSGVCGTQTVSVQVRCMDVTNPDHYYNAWDESSCASVPKPATTREITSQDGCKYDYAIGTWSTNAPSCGQVQETRTVNCQAPDGSPATEAQCATYFTPTDAQASAGMSSSEFWSQGAVYWPEIGSPNYYGNFLSIYRMPAPCDKGDMTAIQDECTVRFRVSSTGAHLGYIKPKSTRFVSDARTCTPSEASDYGSYHWNTPTYVPDQTGVCGSNTKTGRVFCIQNETGSEVSAGLCNPADKPLEKVTFDDTSGCPATTPAPTPTPTPSPTPEVVQVPSETPVYGPPAVIELGACRYTSSGGGRYACGQTFRQNSNPAPFPHELCSGNIIAGSETEITQEYQTFNAGPGWKVKPTLKDVKGARCVVNYRSYGYSDSVQEGWESVYFDGPPTGVQGGLFISKKP